MTGTLATPPAGAGHPGYQNEKAIAGLLRRIGGGVEWGTGEEGIGSEIRVVVTRVRRSGSP